MKIRSFQFKVCLIGGYFTVFSSFKINFIRLLSLNLPPKDTPELLCEGMIGASMVTMRPTLVGSCVVLLTKMRPTLVGVEHTWLVIRNVERNIYRFFTLFVL